MPIGSNMYVLLLPIGTQDRLRPVRLEEEDDEEEVERNSGYNGNIFLHRILHPVEEGEKRNITIYSFTSHIALGIGSIP